MPRQPPATALVLTAVISVQGGAALAKGVFADVGPTGAAVLRLSSASLLLLAIWRPALPRVGRRLLLAYGVALGCMNLAFYLALDRVPLGVAVTIEFLGPLGVAVAGSRRRRDLAVVLVAAAGVLLLARGGAGSLNPVGMALAALAGCCWAAYIYLSAAVGRRTSGGEPLALAMLAAAVVALPFGTRAALQADLHSVLIGVAVGLLSSVLPYSLELEALRRLPPRAFGVLMCLEPVAAALFGFVVLGETLTLRQLGGIGCVIAACVAVTAWTAATAAATTV